MKSTISNEQLELTLAGVSRSRPSRRRSRRSASAARADFWFSRMRQVVAAAIDYPPAPVMEFHAR